MSKYDKYPPLIVRGALFTFRTLHAPDGRRTLYEILEGNTLDKLMTITMPAIKGSVHRSEPSMTVEI